MDYKTLDLLFDRRVKEYNKEAEKILTTIKIYSSGINLYGIYGIRNENLCKLEYISREVERLTFDFLIRGFILDALSSKYHSILISYGRYFFDFLINDINTAFTFSNDGFNNVEFEIKKCRKEGMRIDKVIHLYFGLYNYPVTYLNNYECEVKIKDFFDEYILEDYFDQYLSKVKEITSNSFDAININDIPDLQGRYLNNFRYNIVNTLYEFNGHIDFIPFNDIDNMDNSLSLAAKSTLLHTAEVYKQFYEEGFYKLLIGESDFAKSFITSEYLFQNFKNNGSIDLTTIVVGYFKCVEQLLMNIVRMRKDLGDSYITAHIRKKVWDKLSPEYKEKNYKTLIVNGNLVHEIRVSNDLEQHQIGQMKTELGSLGYYFTRNDNVTTYDCDEKRLFQDLFELFTKKQRNTYLHKINIDSWHDVGIIRNDAIFILICILGSLNTVNSVEDTFHALGYLDDELDNFYRCIRDDCANKIVKMEFNGSVEKVFCLRDYSKKFVYDDLGLIISHPFEFIKSNSLENYSGLAEGILQYDRREAIDIDRGHIPDKVYVGNVVVYNKQTK